MTLSSISKIYPSKSMWNKRNQTYRANQANLIIETRYLHFSCLISKITFKIFKEIKLCFVRWTNQQIHNTRLRPNSRTCTTSRMENITWEPYLYRYVSYCKVRRYMFQVQSGNNYMNSDLFKSLMFKGKKKLRPSTKRFSCKTSIKTPNKICLIARLRLNSDQTISLKSRWSLVEVVELILLWP